MLLLGLMLSSLPVTPPALAQEPTESAARMAQVEPQASLGRPQSAAPFADNSATNLVNSDPNTPVTPLYLVPPGETGIASADVPATALPELDLRPMIAEWQAAGSPVNTPIFEQTNMTRLQAQAPAPDLPANSPGLVTVGPDEANATLLRQRASTSPMAPQPALDLGQMAPISAEARLEPNQTGPPQNCAQLLQDPGNSQPTVSPPIWPVYDQIVYYADNAFTSPPYAWQMIENEQGDTVFSNRGTDLDSFGQPFNLPADTLSLVTQFRYRYNPGSTGSGDRLFAELFLVGANDYQLGAFITGASLEVSTLDDGQWRTATWILDDAAILEAVRGERVILLLSTYNNNNGVNAVVYLDDITATACGEVIVGGNLRRLGNGNTSSGNLSNALLLLIAGNEDGEFVPLAITTPRSDGLYAFGGLPALAEGLYYRVIYVSFNPSGGALDDSRLSLGYGPYEWGPIGASEIVVLANFDISNIILAKPDPYATVVAPAGQNVAFTWRSRGLPNDKYQYCLYDPQTVYPDTNDPIQLCTDVLSGLQANIGPDSFPDDYPFRYGQRYAWYVVGGPDANNNNLFEQYGYSFYEHPIIFVESASQPPNQPRPPSGTLPSKDTRRAWTIMIYFGGDNDLGDINRLPNPISNLQGQFEALKRAAPSFSDAHVVAFGDFFGNTGSSICYLSDPSGPQCRELGEQNSTDPAVLTSFINQGLAFPADQRMLVISSHGHAIVGANLDETTTGQPTMAPDQIVKAMADARLNEAGRKLDVLFFNACLMANFEIAAMMAPFANFMVASAD
ncbi:MAG: clostripain-related cysteine peptidase, partial [Oscillochloridaceae bacterium umkhey_bin13]